MQIRTKAILLFVTALSFVVLLYTATARSDEEMVAREFLEGYGWETDKSPCERAEVTIPKAEDEVYKSYNKLQNESGYDLTRYAGKSAIRYTFLIKNYPVDVGEKVYGNVLVFDGYVVGGDIMTRSLSGFMHGVAENAPIF